MAVQGTNWAEWLMVFVFTGALAFVGYLVKRYLENGREDQKENTNAMKELTGSSVILAEKLNSFQLHCAYIESNNTTRLNKHSDEIGDLQGNSIRIDAKVTECDNRLTKVEKKIAI